MEGGAGAGAGAGTGSTGGIVGGACKETGAGAVTNTDAAGRALATGAGC